MLFYIVHRDTLEVLWSYRSNEPMLEIPYDDSPRELYIHVECPLPIQECLVARRLEDGSIEMTYDREKMEAYRQRSMKNIRQERNRRLAETDWVMLRDVPLIPEKDAMLRAYRQQLRDITDTIHDPDDFQWPEKPSF